MPADLPPSAPRERTRHVRVLADSACALPAELLTANEIGVVPLRLTVGERSFTDDEVALEQLVEMLDQPVMTSGPAPGEWAQAFEDALDGAEAVVALTVSAAMSSTFDSARLAGTAYGDRVCVVDTGTAAGGEALVALAAARRADEGAELQSVVATAQDVVHRVRLDATVSSLDHLIRSGRVPSLAGWAGRKMGVQPMFEFARDEVRILRPAFSRPAALDRIVRGVASSRTDDDAGLHAAALHALAPEAGELLLSRLRDLGPVDELFAASFSPVMVAHTGAGLAGVAWWWE